MGNIFISLDDSSEGFLRRFALERFGAKKGAISKTVTAALIALKQNEGREKAVARLLSSMEKGVDLGLRGRKIYSERGELYD